MALQSESIDDRLEGLQQEDRRLTFGSNLRAFRLDLNPEAHLPSNHAAMIARRAEGEHPVDQVITLLEELSRRIDCLEAKDRALADEIRLRARQDRRRRSIRLVSEVTGLAIFVFCWMMKLI